jgi:hypothetical protein
MERVIPNAEIHRFLGTKSREARPAMNFPPLISQVDAQRSR